MNKNFIEESFVPTCIRFHGFNEAHLFLPLLDWMVVVVVVVTVLASAPLLSGYQYFRYIENIKSKKQPSKIYLMLRSEIHTMNFSVCVCLYNNLVDQSFDTKYWSKKIYKQQKSFNASDASPPFQIKI